MSIGVILTMEQAREVDEIKANWPLEKKLQGTCAGCGRGIPVGYLSVVTQWQTVEWGKDFPVAQPATLYCRECGVSTGPQTVFKRKRVRLDPTTMTAADIAKRVIRSVIKKPRTGLHVASDAGLQWERPVFLVLKALADAGKIKRLKEDGEKSKWVAV